MDELYIKMCIAAQNELRRNWIPKAGDRVLTRWNSDKHKIEIDYYSKDFITKEASVLLHKRTDVWLPRQEDLQQLLKNKQEWDNELLNLKFSNWIKEDVARFEFDLNKLWLCFVMKTVYNKQWDGERWDELR